MTGTKIPFQVVMAAAVAAVLADMVAAVPPAAMGEEVRPVRVVEVVGKGEEVASAGVAVRKGRLVPEVTVAHVQLTRPRRH